MVGLGMLARRLWTRLRRQQQVDSVVDQEMQLHVALLERQLQEEGMPEDQAATAARQRFGNALKLREECRDVWGWTWLDDLRSDLRFGLRGLLRNPGFLTVVLLTLAVGVGGASAIAGAIHGILLKPLPYPQPDRLVTVWQHA